MRIAIVGGGASGVLTAVQLARCWTGEVRPQVFLYDASARVARGAAYSTENPRHLLNVPAGRMSALADEPDHFVRWLARDSPTVTPEDYRPRIDYGNYLAHCLAMHARDVGLTVRHVSVDDIERAGDEWRVWHSRGIDAVDAVVLALGRPSDLVRGDPRSVAATARAMGYRAGATNQLVEDYRRVTRRARVVYDRVFFD